MDTVTGIKSLVLLLVIISVYKVLYLLTTHKSARFTDSIETVQGHVTVIPGRKGTVTLTQIDAGRDPVTLTQIDAGLNYSSERNTEWNSARMETLARETLNTSYFRPLAGKTSIPGFSSPCWREGEKSRDTAPRMRCLPAVYIAGSYKSGSTDLAEMTSLHADVIPPAVTEPLLHLWGGCRTRNASSIPVGDYLRIMDKSVAEIDGLVSRGRINAARRGIILDNTVTLLHTRVTMVTLPHYLSLINPHARYVFILRHPVTWLESCVNYYGKIRSGTPRSATELHNRTLHDVQTFNTCLLKSGDVRGCSEVYISDVCSVINVVYYIHLKTWISVIPPGQIYVIKAEDYYHDRLGEMERLVTWLGLTPLGAWERSLIQNYPRHNSGTHWIRLLPATKNLLRQFYKPWNQKLAVLLNNTKFLWN